MDTSPSAEIGLLVHRPAAVVPAGLPMREVAATMVEEGVGCVLLAGGAGVVTEHDIARAVAAGQDPELPVGPLATPHPVAVDPETPVVRAAGLMLDEHLRHP